MYLIDLKLDTYYRSSPARRRAGGDGRQRKTSFAGFLFPCMMMAGFPVSGSALAVVFADEERLGGELPDCLPACEEMQRGQEKRRNAFARTQSGFPVPVVYWELCKVSLS